MGFSRNFKFLISVSGSLILVEFGGFFRYRVDISRNLRLMDFSEFPRFQFGVRAVYYKAFLLIIRGSK